MCIKNQAYEKNFHCFSRIFGVLSVFGEAELCIPDEFRYISMKNENIFAASFAAGIITSKWGPDGFVSRQHREERQRNRAKKMNIRWFVNAVSGNFFARPLAFLRGFGYAKGEENASV